MISIFKVILPEYSFNKKSESKIYIDEDINEVSINEVEFSDISTSLKVDRDFHIKRYGFEMSHNEILSFYTHIKVWKEFLNFHHDSQWAMIIESNVNLEVSFKSIKETVVSLPEDCDIFFPYEIEDDHNEGTDKLLNLNIRERNIVYPYLFGHQWGYSFYFISRHGANKLLKINKITQRLDDEILSLTLTKKINCYVSKVNWFSYKNLNLYEFNDRKENIWNAIINNSSWDTNSSKKIKKILSILSNIASSLKFDLILQGGTHLSYVRHEGKIMPWDDDVDLGINENELTPFLNKLDKMDSITWNTFLEKHTNTVYYKIWLKDGEPINGFDHKFPFVDIWLYNVEGNDLVFKNGIICSNSAIKPFTKVVFEDSLFAIPYNSLEVLDSRYMDWRNKIRVYTWSHRLEKSFFPPLVIDIITNNTGNMINLK